MPPESPTSAVERSHRPRQFSCPMVSWLLFTRCFHTVFGLNSNGAAPTSTTNLPLFLPHCWRDGPDPKWLNRRRKPQQGCLAHFPSTQGTMFLLIVMVAHARGSEVFCDPSSDPAFFERPFLRLPMSTTKKTSQPQLSGSFGVSFWISLPSLHLGRV